MPDFKNIEQELQRYPISVTEEFRNASHNLELELSAEDLDQWATTGVAIAQHTVRAWEAAAEYFRVSQRMLKTLPFSRFLEWASLSSSLSDASPSIAAAYIRNAPGVVSKLTLPQMEQWAQQGLQMYRGTWKSSSLASKFFDSTPDLLEHLSFSELRQFVTFITNLSEKSYDLASECVVMSEHVLSNLTVNKGAFIALANTLVETNWRETRSYFEIVDKALSRIDPSQRLRYLNIVEYLVKGGMGHAATFLNETSEALSQLSQDSHSRIFSLSESLLLRHPNAIEEFLMHVPNVLPRVSLTMLGTWFEEGIRILGENNEAGLAYFRMESTRAEEVLNELSSGIELGRVREVLRMYCRALSGIQVEILPTQDLISKSVGWTTENAATTEGNHVFLPEIVDRYTEKTANFQWLKVVSTHQIAHLEFNSFEFQYERPATQFRNLRFDLTPEDHMASTRETLTDKPNNKTSNVGLEGAWLTDMEHFFDLFKDRKLALDVFTVAEDSRIDARVQKEYPGLRQAYQEIQKDTLSERPNIGELPARQALVEFLIRLSLQQYRGLPVPKKYIKEAKAIAHVVRRLVKPDLVLVEDTAEATLRIYRIITRLPNEEISERQWEDLDLDDLQNELSDDELEDLLNELDAQTTADVTAEPSAEIPYQSPQDVEYRGDFKPELTQMMNKLRQTQQEWLQDPSAGEQVTREMLEQILQKNAELQAVQGEITNSSGLYANNMMREAGLPQAEPYSNYVPHTQTDDEGGPLETSEPNAYLYDEWDFRANDYRPRWCIVREREMEEGDPQFYENTMKDYASLVTKIRRQFELLMPEMFRKVRRLPDGEEFDFDAVIEAQVDLRTGNSPSEKLFWRRNKVGREVAVAFLLDMSASTAEAIDQAKQDRTMQDAPDDPVEYMLWLRMRRGEEMRRSFKRIIDLEKESITLLIEALETIGDVYGIYGFSGYGRENVEFYVIKDLFENLSSQITNRIDKISPLHATRMGPAIRHTVNKLQRVDARSKLLFLISDGRPQDRGYSREGVEKEYAVHDTRMALREARRKNIIPFCLTVDKQGHDYLKTMCQDMGYEVLGDISALPERLPMLYRKLTI